MKKQLILISILLLICSSAFAAQSFNTGWSESSKTGDAVFSPSGNSLGIATNMSSPATWSSSFYDKNFDGDHGVFATFNVSASSAGIEEEAGVGFRKFVAKTLSGSRILASIWMSDVEGNHQIRYKVEEWDPSDSFMLQSYCTGNFSSEMDTLWLDGENVTMGLAFKNGIVYFWCDKVGSYIQKELFDIAEEMDADSQIETFANGTGASISATVTNLDVWSIERYIPHITAISSWTDFLQVDNNSEFHDSFTLTFYDESGKQVYSGMHNVAANNKVVLQPKTLSSAARTGKIFTTNKELVFRYAYEHSNGGVAEFLLTDNLYTKAGFYFNSTASIVEWKGLAIASFTGVSNGIRLYAYGSSGLLASATDTVPANGKLVGQHTKWFPNIKIADIEKIIVVSSNHANALGGLVICGNDEQSNLLFMPAGNTLGFSGP